MGNFHGSDIYGGKGGCFRCQNELFLRHFCGSFPNGGREGYFRMKITHTTIMGVIVGFYEPKQALFASKLTHISKWGGGGVF